MTAAQQQRIIGRPKPVAGFGSVTEAVVALRAADVPFDEIARRTGCPESSLRTLAARARPQGKARLSIPGDITRRLLSHAEARGLTVSELAADILAAALDQGVAAILADGDAS